MYFITMATEQRQKELALRAWKANRKLIAFCQQPALQATTMRSVSFVWEIWRTLGDGELQFLIETNELPDLIPVSRPNLEQFRDLLRARATVYRRRDSRQRGADLSKYWAYEWPRAIDYPAIAKYLPIRWAYERQRALALSEDIGVTNSAVKSQNDFRDPLVHEYSVLTFLEGKFAERLRQKSAATETANVGSPKDDVTVEPQEN